MPRVREDLIRRAALVDYVDELALVALSGDDVIGVARYVRVAEHPDRAEVTFTVRDDHQGQGLGGVLLEHLAAAARQRDVRVFEADTSGGGITVGWAGIRLAAGRAAAT